MPADGASVHRGIDTVAFADLLREPRAASRAELEMLAAADCPDPGMIGDCLGPALRELGRAGDLLPASPRFRRQGLKSMTMAEGGHRKLHDDGVPVALCIDLSAAVEAPTSVPGVRPEERAA